MCKWPRRQMDIKMKVYNGLEDGFKIGGARNANNNLILKVSQWPKRGMIMRIALTVLVVIFIIQPRFSIHYRHIPRKHVFSELVPGLNVQIYDRFDSGRKVCQYEDILMDETLLEIPKMGQNITVEVEGIESGQYVPGGCRPLFSTAVLVPYRNRSSQLELFLPYIHSFLQRQRIHYRVFVLQQGDGGLWNKGKLYNAGARLATSLGFPCLVLHDVDMLPLNPANLYACSTSPRHMSASVDKFRYNLPYDYLIGGALAIRSTQYQQLNGFSNKYLMWGGEDDDLYYRMESENITLQRFPPDMSRYSMMVHEQEPLNKERFQLLKENLGKHQQDGLSTLHYRSMTISHQRLYTNVTVRL